MRALTIARREMYAYLRSPLGSAIIAAALLVDGILFYWQSGIEQKPGPTNGPRRSPNGATASPLCRSEHRPAYPSPLRSRIPCDVPWAE